MDFDLKRDTVDKKDYKLKTLLGIVKIRKRLDWSMFMSPIKSQGGLGSCASFATVAMKEYEEFRERQKK